MANRSFDAQKAELDEASAALRCFTLARRGATEKAGILAIERVNAVCDRMKKLFSTGTHAIRFASILIPTRRRILAAETRLALLVCLRDFRKSPQSQGQDGLHDLGLLRVFLYNRW
jgi:hypothetical protein